MLDDFCAVLMLIVLIHFTVNLIDRIVYMVNRFRHGLTLVGGTDGMCHPVATIRLRILEDAQHNSVLLLLFKVAQQ